jgi:DNA (cytosine-5)-methyltransferase 1
MALVLSLFPGIDLLGRGFEAEGFSVVRGPDLIWGQTIESFHAPAGRFDGIIAGSPCQDFSRLRRAPPTGNGLRMLEEFARVVSGCRPEWFLLENVPTVPNISIEGYRVQRFDLSARECGMEQLRRRHFQFGSLAGRPLIIDRIETPHRAPLAPICTATEGKQANRRTFADFCELQGLPRDFELPGWPIAFKYRAVGNGVPVPMARVIARAIVTFSVTCTPAESPGRSQIRLCACDCGRVVGDRRTTAKAACRKRMQRKRDRMEEKTR